MFKKTNIVGLERICCFDSKPFTYINDQLEYAKERYVINTPNLIIRVRIYNNWLFKVVLISDFSSFDISKTTNKYLSEQNLLTKEEQETIKSINIYIIEENTLRTREFAKDNTILTKKGYQQILIYNANEVVLDYYNVLPEFDFNLMKYYRTMVYFDLACHSKEGD